MLPWGIELWGMHRHPSQIYEILATLIILALLWPGKVRVQSQASGIYFLSFCVISSLSRLFLEAFRGDSFVVLDHFRGGQIGAWIVLAVCLAGIIFKKNIPGV
jgi:phosphatidylglycerol:prolipoprotein diacylglycerol transferase